MITPRLISLLILGGMLFSLPLRAEEPVAKLAKKLPELTWCLDHFSRFHHYEDTPQPYGPSVDLMQELAKRAGFVIRFTPRTAVNRCFRLMEEGKVDLMSNLKFSAERDKIMFLLPYEKTVPESVFMRRDDERQVSNYPQLKNMAVASIRGYLFSQPTMQFLQHNKSYVAEVDSIESGLEMLHRSRVDALIAPTISTSEAIFSTASYQDRFKIATLIIEHSQADYINIGFSRTSPHSNLLPLISAELQQMQQDGTVKRLYTDIVRSTQLKQLKEP